MRKKKCHRSRTSPTTDDWHDVVEDFEEEFAVYRSLEAGADGHRSAGIPPPPGEFPIYRSLGAGVGSHHPADIWPPPRGEPPTAPLAAIELVEDTISVEQVARMF